MDQTVLQALSLQRESVFVEVFFTMPQQMGYVVELAAAAVMEPEEWDTAQLKIPTAARAEQIFQHALVSRALQPDVGIVVATAVQELMRIQRTSHRVIHVCQGRTQIREVNSISPNM